MSERLEDKCRELIEKKEYETCEKEIADAMVTMPHSAVPHNLMGILLEKEHNHILAMKHFRAAYGLDPAYVPARYNMDSVRHDPASGGKTPVCIQRGGLPDITLRVKS